MAECRSCGAAIEWAVTEGGKVMPVDQGEAPAGNLAVAFPRNGWGSSRVRSLASGEDPEPGERRTVSHYATCPDAEKWRERGQRSKERSREYAEAERRGAEAAYRVLGMLDG